MNQDEVLRSEYPELSHKERQLISNVQIPGLEEEAYRRIASVHAAIKSVFKNGHPLLLAIFGQEYFKRMAASIFQVRKGDDGLRNVEDFEILDISDGYLIGPRALKVFKEFTDDNYRWVGSVLEYEWAIWGASRVAMGWPPASLNPPLANGASLVAADFDLRSLLTQIRRLERSRVGEEVMRWRLYPSPGVHHCVIYPSNGSVKEAMLDESSYHAIQDAIMNASCRVSDQLTGLPVELDLFVETGFLCCSRESLEQARLEQLSEVVTPLPH